MAANNQARFVLGTFMVALVCVSFTGCQGFDLITPKSILPTAEELEVNSGADAKQANVMGQYQMQLIPSRGQPSVEKINITGPVTVQDALVASGATKKFRGMKISLGRIIKDKGTLLKLPVEYEFRSKSVRPEQNYEVLPGDTITVSPKKSETLEKLIKSATGG